VAYRLSARVTDEFPRAEETELINTDSLAVWDKDTTHSALLFVIALRRVSINSPLCNKSPFTATRRN
jgi:hypothetical protein